MFSFWIAESFIFQSLSFRLSKQAVSMSHSTEEWSEPPDTWLPFLIALRTLRAWVLRDLSWSLVLPSGWFYMACKQKGKKQFENTPKMQKSNRLGSITDYHTPYRPQCPSGSGEHGLQKSGWEYAWSYRNAMRHFPTSEKGSCPREAAIGTVSHVDRVSRLTQYSSKSVSVLWNTLRWSPQQAVIEIRNSSFGISWIWNNNSFKNPVIWMTGVSDSERQLLGLNRFPKIICW